MQRNPARTASAGTALSGFPKGIAGPSRYALLLLGLSLSPLPEARTQSPTLWKKSPTRISSLHSIVHGGGLFLALNATGRILVSEDGLTWQERPLGAKHRLNHVIHAGGTFLGVGDSGTVMTSTDAHAWTERFPGTKVNLHAVASMPGGFLAVGDKGTVLLSKDGETWTRSPTSHSEELASAACGDSGCVVIGPGGASLFSPDGKAWTPGQLSAAANKVIYADRRFLAVGEKGAIQHSLDGKTWVEAVVPDSISLRDVIRGPEGYLAVGDSGKALVSRDGRAWTRHAMEAVRHGSGPASMVSVAHGKGRYVAVGTKEALMVSPDGARWTSLNFHPGNRRSVAFGAGRYVSVGSGNSIGLSVDGVLWTKWEAGIPGLRQLNAILFARGRFLAVGDGGIILASPDGERWEQRMPDTLGFNLQDIAFGQRGYVAVGHGRPAVSHGETYRSAGGFILTSPDGLAWTARRNPAHDDLFSVAYGNGRYVAAGEGGRIFSSPDGKSWTLRKSGSEARLFSVAYGAGLFVVVGWGGTILTSPEAMLWTDRSVPVERFLRKVIFNGRQFVAAGTASAICTSADGLRWQLGSTSLLQGLPGGLASGSSGHVLLESFGATGYTSDSFITLEPSSGLTAIPSLSVQLEGKSLLRIGIPAELRAHQVLITVTDAAGRKVLESRMPGREAEVLFPVGDLPPGAYWVELDTSPVNGRGQFHIFPERKAPSGSP